MSAVYADRRCVNFYPMEDLESSKPRILLLESFYLSEQPLNRGRRFLWRLPTSVRFVLDVDQAILEVIAIHVLRCFAVAMKFETRYLRWAIRRMGLVMRWQAGRVSQGVDKALSILPAGTLDCWCK